MATSPSEWCLLGKFNERMTSSRAAMAYDLHIERADERPIELSEWRTAVEASEGVRLFAPAAHAFTNPKTGEVISIAAREGDAEVLFPDGKWVSVCPSAFETIPLLWRWRIVRGSSSRRRRCVHR